LQAFEEGRTSPDIGLHPYLSLRNTIVLAHITHIAFYLMLKAEGKEYGCYYLYTSFFLMLMTYQICSVKDHPVIAALLSDRKLFEKLKPLDEQYKDEVPLLGTTTCLRVRTSLCAD
jgi:hypothetical protein